MGELPDFTVGNTFTDKHWRNLLTNFGGRNWLLVFGPELVSDIRVGFGQFETGLRVGFKTFPWTMRGRDHGF